MRIVTYNVHYGVGQDGKYDAVRLAEAVRGADVIALQEVSRGNPANGGRDMVAELRALLPEYFCAFGSNFEANVGSRLVDGRAVDATFQLGNMVLSIAPISLSRNLLLPRRRSFDHMNFQRGALEALIDTPFGPIRFYATHLHHRDPQERLEQIEFLRERMQRYALEGGGISGLAEVNLPEPDYPEAYLLLGDFNMLDGSAEYAAIGGAPDHEFGMAVVGTRAIDAGRLLMAAGEDDTTYVSLTDPADSTHHKRLDYIFAAPVLSPRLRRAWVDRSAIGSDHFPLWLELG